MALLYSPAPAHNPLSSLYEMEALLDAFAHPTPPSYASCRGATCASPLGAPWGWPAAPAPAALHPAATAYALHLRRQPSPAPPAKPEVQLSRLAEGVLARCRLGRGFTSRDIRLTLDSSDFTITAFHPGTAHWPDRPVVYRRTLHLAPHIDAAAISPRFDAGTLSILFPYRRPPQPQPQQLRVVVVQQAPAAHAPGFTPRPARSAAPSAPAPRPVPATIPVATAIASAAAPCFCRQQAPQPQELPSSSQPPAGQPAARSRHLRAPRGCGPAACHQRPRPAPRTVRVEGPEAAPAQAASVPVSTASPRQKQQRQEEEWEAVLREATPPHAADEQPAAFHQQEGPSSPAPAAAPPAEEQQAAEDGAAAVPVLPAAAADKGKAPASPEQAAALERREAARRAAERIAAGEASDSDWEEADGSVSDCPLDK